MWTSLVSVVTIIQVLFARTSHAQLPTLYEYYTDGGITSGLSVDQPTFVLNERNISIYSGAMHYFRIPRQYWRDRLRKLRAAGLNTVETYVSWNLHEPYSGVYDFGDGGSDFQDFLDIQEYLRIAQEEDLFVIVRSGPYICAEWEFGGLPSWLLREDGIHPRSSDPVYMAYVERYFNVLLPLLEPFQFTNGGPVIAFQVENEYGYSPERDLVYIQELVDIIRANGIVELLVSSDGAGSGTSGTIPGLIFQTVNFGDNPEESLDRLTEMQPNKPAMVMEFWTGWFDHWTENHNTKSDATFRDLYDRILRYPASVNMYMFHGGTNWGFLNGGNGDDQDYLPTTTSYDYDAPLSEAGDYTGKYDIVKELIAQYNTIQTLTPEPPAPTPRMAYASVAITEYLSYSSIVSQLTNSITSDVILNMEQLDINGNSGQSYGYIIYRLNEAINLPADSTVRILDRVHDAVIVMVNGVSVAAPLHTADDLNGFGYWRVVNSSQIITSEETPDSTVDLLVENWGRINIGGSYHSYDQRKGLNFGETVYINDQEITASWVTYPLEFKKDWINGLVGWQMVEGSLPSGPAFYKGTLTVDEPQDTFIDMQAWTKGIVIVNGFVLGRYALIGPQQSLYLPGPFLRQGDNDIIIFEHFTPTEEIRFSADPIFNTPGRH